MAIPAKLKQMVGKATRPVTFEIEKGQIRRFAQAIGEENPLHSDEKVAKAAGFPSLVAPPTLVGSLGTVEELCEHLGLSDRATMHAEEEYEYFRPICAGDEITMVHRLVNAYDKNAPNGRLIFVVIETRATDKKARAVCKGRRVLVELKN